MKFEEFLTEARRPPRFKAGDVVEVAGDKWNKGYKATVVKVQAGEKSEYDKYTLRSEGRGGNVILFGPKQMKPWTN